MSNSIFLPQLMNVKITNYSLYNKDIEYNFIDGINLIIGGNGVGKTTFVNIVKYALIGLYKNDLVVRNYQGEKRFNRETYRNTNVYFRNRMQNLPSDKDASVELKFVLNNCTFYVKRSLYDTILLEASFVENGEHNVINGEPIRQDYYSRFENDNEIDKNKYLQYNYEKAVAQKANMTDFNDFIFFVNQILMFGEDRTTVLWDENIQERLLSNYLNDPVLESERKSCTFDAKYQDSIARHKQEEIKAIRRVIEQVSSNFSNAQRAKDTQRITSDIEKHEGRLISLEKDASDIHRKAHLIHKKISDISVSINNKEQEINTLESELLSEYWPGINPKYMTYKKQYTINHICPMCNASIEINSNENAEDTCFLCHGKITPSNNNRVGNLKSELSELLALRQNLELEVLQLEEDLDNIDSNVRRTRLLIFELKNQLRNLDGELGFNSGTDDAMEKETSYIAMVKRIQELNQEKDVAQQKCEMLRNKCSDIVSTIEQNLIDSTQKISEIFKEFTEAFLRLPCYLTLDKSNIKKINIFIPVIDGKIRIDAEELSESQRFFVDYSFRMSILAHFYNGPSFYICETPDASLDLSYEENAANTLLKYLEKANSLIMTSNLNNSTFIMNIIKKSKNINVLNLLKYGKVSQVQTNHEALQKLSNDIEELVYGKL